MRGEANQAGRVVGVVLAREERVFFPRGLLARPRGTFLIGAVLGALALVGFAPGVLFAGAEGPQAPPEVVVHASDLPESALSEFDFWEDMASPGGKLVGTPNHGDELDPPPENDPHVVFKARVRRGVPYRCWIHMKVGKAKGKSQANLFYVQFTDAVDQASKEILKPGTGNYLAVRGPAREGWTWVGRELAAPKSSEPLIYFRTDGEVTVRLQAGMEGVGFDQLLLSPARYLEKPPAEAVVAKPRR